MTLPAPDPAAGSAANKAASVARHAVGLGLADGTLTLDDVWAQVDAEGDHKPVGHIHLRALLLDLSHIGEVKADEVLAQLGLEGTRHIVTLGTIEREALAAAVTQIA